jgi:hypothetical protein
MFQIGMGAKSMLRISGRHTEKRTESLVIPRPWAEESAFSKAEKKADSSLRSE